MFLNYKNYRNRASQWVTLTKIVRNWSYLFKSLFRHKEKDVSDAHNYTTNSDFMALETRKSCYILAKLFPPRAQFS
jgi:hypothetical protein